MYLKKTPCLIKRFYSGAVFNLPAGENTIYLTFDDSPQPLSTAGILQILNSFDIKATFFCTGKNVEEHNELFHQIIDQGHRLGNHSYSHLNGWKSSGNSYISDVSKASDLIESDLFRPPYGKISFNQFRKLKKRYRIIFWSSIPGDFADKLSADIIFERLRNSSKDGAIIVLHDHSKSIERTKEYLPQYLRWALDKGFKFDSL